MTSNIRFAGAVLLLCPCITLAAEVTGTVRDILPPGKGIFHAKVHLKDGKDNLVAKADTNRVGKYQLKAVSKGDYILHVAATQYISRKKNVRVDKGDLTGIDVELVEEFGSRGYYASVATVFVGRGAKSDNKDRYYRDIWTELRSDGLPTKSKAELVFSIHARDDTAKKAVPSFEQFLKADVGDITKLHEALSKAIAGDAPVPNKGMPVASRLGPEVVADAVLNVLQTSKAPPEKKKAFTKEFELKWEGTESAKILYEWKKKGLDKPIDSASK
jgi:hypothetical protein